MLICSSISVVDSRELPTATALPRDPSLINFMQFGGKFRETLTLQPVWNPGPAPVNDHISFVFFGVKLFDLAYKKNVLK